MAYDIFVNVNDKTVKGESTDAGHAGEIKAQSLSWGYVQHAIMSARGEGSSTGKAEFQEIHFTKFLDSTSPALYLALASGKRFPTVTISLRKAGIRSDFAVFTLGAVVVTSVEGSGGGDEAPIEDVGLTYEAVTWEVATPGGGRVAPGARLGWSRKLGKAITAISGG